MNILKRELKSYLKSNLIWSFSIIAFIIMIMSEFSAYYNNPEMQEMIEMIPESFIEALSMQNANLTELSGFISFASVYFYIILSIHAVLLGSSIISKEERDKTCEFFMVMPISRTKIMINKLLSAILMSLWINIVTFLAVVITSMQYSRKNEFMGQFVLVMVSVFILQMIFVSIGFLTASMVKKYKKSGSYSVGILFVFYIMSIVISLSDKIDFLKYFTPFKYYDANRIFNAKGFEPIYLIISVAVILICFTISFVVYPKRDLKI